MLAKVFKLVGRQISCANRNFSQASSIFCEKNKIVDNGSFPSSAGECEQKNGQKKLMYRRPRKKFTNKNKRVATFIFEKRPRSNV